MSSNERDEFFRKRSAEFQKSQYRSSAASNTNAPRQRTKVEEILDDIKAAMHPPASSTSAAHNSSSTSQSDPPSSLKKLTKSSSTTSRSNAHAPSTAVTMTAADDRREKGKRPTSSDDTHRSKGKARADSSSGNSVFKRPTTPLRRKGEDGSQKGRKDDEGVNHSGGKDVDVPVSVPRLLPFFFRLWILSLSRWI